MFSIFSQLVLNGWSPWCPVAGANEALGKNATPIISGTASSGSVSLLLYTVAETWILLLRNRLPYVSAIAVSVPVLSFSLYADATASEISTLYTKSCISIIFSSGDAAIVGAVLNNVSGCEDRLNCKYRGIEAGIGESFSPKKVISVKGLTIWNSLPLIIES